MPFSLKEHENYVTNAVSPEDVRDIVVLIFREISMRQSGYRSEKTGFEAASLHELDLAFYRALNELVRRAYRPRYVFLQDTNVHFYLNHVSNLET
jgi:hypothetical protein